MKKEKVAKSEEKSCLDAQVLGAKVPGGRGNHGRGKKDEGRDLEYRKSIRSRMRKPRRVEERERVFLAICWEG